MRHITVNAGKESAPVPPPPLPQVHVLLSSASRIHKPWCRFFFSSGYPIAHGSEKKKKSTLITQSSTLTSLVILRLTECSAGLECASPDAARRHSSPEDTHMGAQLRGRFFEKCVWPVWKIYLRRCSHRVHSCTASHSCWNMPGLKRGILGKSEGKRVTRCWILPPRCYLIYISSWHQVLCPSWQSFWWSKVPISKIWQFFKKKF